MKSLRTFTILMLFAYLSAPLMEAQGILHFDENGGVGIMIDTTLTDSTITIVPNSDFQKFGYHFTTWNTEADNSGNTLNPGDTIGTSNTNITLYAQWAKYCGGDGSSTSPWQICSKEALILLSNTPLDWSAHFIQTEDIYFDTDPLLEDWDGADSTGLVSGFSPIGNMIAPFSGTYDGQNHTIHNLYINNTPDYQGLFGLADSAIISNLALNNANIIAKNYTGSMVGKATNNTKLNSVKCQGKVNGRAFVGGLVGSLEQSEVNESNFCGDIEADGNIVGGLIGRQSWSTINSSYSSGNITSNSQNIGGLVGFVQNDSYINNCYSTAGANGDRYIGGLVGIVSSSYINNSYSTGYTSGNDYTFGFAGMINSSYLSNCFFDSSTSWDNNISTGLSAINTASFLDSSTFDTWDYGLATDAPWVNTENHRPTLYWQTTMLNNGIVTNSDSAYILTHAYANNPQESTSGYRYKNIDSTDWVWELDSISNGKITKQIDSIEKGSYLIQVLSTDSNFTYYGDLTKVSFYELSFDANGGLGMMDQMLLASRDTILLPSNAYTYPGYEFTNWNTAYDDTGTSYLDQSSIVLSEADLNLFAIWQTKDYKIDYVLNDGTNSPNNPTSYTIDSLIYFEAGAKTGYTFDGWYAEDIFATAIDSLGLDNKQDTTLHAKWSINTYQVILHSNDANNDSIVITDTFDTKISLPIDVFSSQEVTFKHWNTSPTDDGDQYNDGDAYQIGDSTLHLYAQWQRYCAGEGTAAEPWEICNTDALLLLSNSPEDWDKHFIQTADLAFDISHHAVDWKNNGDNKLGFSPIGNTNTPFAGTYNGQHHTISNLYINHKDSTNTGLFAYITNTVFNLGLSNATVNGKENTAALVGLADGATIYNCYANGLICGESNTGGLVGQASNTAIGNSYASCGIEGGNNTGGFVGYSSLSTISNCYSSGVVISDVDAGGFVGAVQLGLITKCVFDQETSAQTYGSADGINIGITALKTEHFSDQAYFPGWTFDIKTETLPWIFSTKGRPYLFGETLSVNNGLTVNSPEGYFSLGIVNQDSTVTTESAGLYYRNLADSVWTVTTSTTIEDEVHSVLSNLELGKYYVQTYAKADGKTYCGDVTLMSLSTLHFETNGGTGTMSDTIIIAGDSINLPTCCFENPGYIHSAWTYTMADTEPRLSPKGKWAIGNEDVTLYAQWMEPFAMDDYFDEVIGGSLAILDPTSNDTLGGIPYGIAFPIEIIYTGTVGEISIEGNKIKYTPATTFSGPDKFSYVVDYNGATDTAEVVILVFDTPGNMVNADCYVDMPMYEWEVESTIQSPETDINEFSTPLIGNLYGDDYPEIVISRDRTSFTSTSVYVYNGSATPLQNGRNQFTVSQYNCAITPMAIAKINVGTDELRPTLFVAGINRRIYAYNPETGAQYWASSSTNTKKYCSELGSSEGATIGIADFNNDGRQEVYAANRIYDAETGVLLCRGLDTQDIGYSAYITQSGGTYSTTHNMMHSSCGDFDGDGDLELAAGSYVYDVDIDNGQMTVLAQLPTSASTNANMIKDGSTTIADIDLDGDLDVVVNHLMPDDQVYCYVWDGATPTLIAEKHITNDDHDDLRFAIGLPFIGDLNGDGKPEIAFTASKKQYAFSYDNTTTLAEYYTLSHTDLSGFTGLTLFDFNNDDIAEIVYRDETELRIINASGISHTTGNDTLNTDSTPILYNLATYDCFSNTQGEFAVVADIDLDNQAEIIVTNGPTSTNRRLSIFESGSNSKWVAARPVWNQYGYNVTNVSNDLTIPSYAINNSLAIEVDSVTLVRPYNHFMQQMGNVTLSGKNVIITPDILVDNSYYVNTGTIGTLTIDIINQGDASYEASGSAICFYGGDPYTGAALLHIDSIRSNIEAGDTLFNQVYTFPVDPSINPYIYIRLNDNGSGTFPSPLDMQEECNYDNNTTLAAILEITSIFTWNNIPLVGVEMNTGDISDSTGFVSMLIARGDTVDLVPTFPGYAFTPDTITLENVQNNGSVSYYTQKVPSIDVSEKTVMYDATYHSNTVSTEADVHYTAYYKLNTDSTWNSDEPFYAGVYDIKVETSGNFLYSSATHIADSSITITPRPLSYIFTIEDKVYDGTDSITTGTIESNLLNNDSVELEINIANIKFSDSNVGTHKILPTESWSISGRDTGSYTLQAYDTTYASIRSKDLNITSRDTSKVYDAMEFHGGNGITAIGFVSGEDTSSLLGQLLYDTLATSHKAVNYGYYDIISKGFSSNNYNITYTAGTLEIEKKFLYVEYNSEETVTYGDSVDLFDYNISSSTELAVGDTFIHKQLGLSDDYSNAGYLKIGLYSLGMDDAYILNSQLDTVTHNYTFSFSTQYINIIQRKVYITGAEAADKIYDANNVATILKAELDGAIPGDSINLYNSDNGQFIQSDAGTDIEIFYNNDVNIEGEDADNYLLIPFSISLFADITPKELTARGTKANNKVYDGNNLAILTGTIFSGVIANDDVYLQNTNNGLFDQSDVGDNINVSENIEIAGKKQDNYYLTKHITLAANISPKPLSIEAKDSTKIYDALAFDSKDYTYTGFVTNQDTSDLLGTPSLEGTALQAVDTGKYEIIPSGFYSNNYAISYISAQLEILPRPIHIIYGGNATITYGDTVDYNDFAPAAGNIAPTDTLVIDEISFQADTSSSGQYKVGEHQLDTSDVNILNSSSENVSYNYTITQDIPTLTVNKKDIYITNYIVEDKVYDGNTMASIDSAILSGVIANDSIILNNHTSGEFISSNAANNITVMPSQAYITGLDTANYKLIQWANLEADITPKQLTIEAADTSKVYDATSFNGSNGITYQGFIDGENEDNLQGYISYTGTSQGAIDTGRYDIVPSGLYSTNYNIDYLESELIITPRVLNISYSITQDEVYGTAIDPLSYPITHENLAGADQLIYNSLSFGDNTSSSGNLVVGNHALTIEDYSISNATYGNVTQNYTVAIAHDSLSIIPKDIYAVLSSQDKEYDGTTSTSVIYDSIIGILENDELIINIDDSQITTYDNSILLMADFNDKNAGNDKAIDLDSISVSGADYKNYSIIIPELIADITPRTTSIIGSASDKIYDGTTEANLDSLTAERLIDSDDVQLTHTNATFAQSDVGSNISISVGSVGLVGTDANNYTLDGVYNLSADIQKAQLTVQTPDIEFIYGDAIPNIVPTYTGFVRNEDASVIDTKPVPTMDINYKSAVGDYTINMDQGQDNNYSLVYLPGQANILVREMSVIYQGEDRICANEGIDLNKYSTDNLAQGDYVNDIYFETVYINDNSKGDAEQHTINLASISIHNEENIDITSNYVTNMTETDITLLDIPQPDLGDDLQFCGACIYDFDAGEGIKYLWSTGDTTRYISVQGFYRGELWVTVENENNCINSDTIDMASNSKYLQEHISMYLYPNPNDGRFTVETSSEVECYAYIYSILGRLIKKVWVEGSTLHFDEDLQVGAYVLKIQDAREVFIVRSSDAL